MTRPYEKSLWLALVTVGVLLMVASLPTLTVYAGLPPRPTPVPPVAPSLSGGFIELHVMGSSMPAGLWTIVHLHDIFSIHPVHIAQLVGPIWAAHTGRTCTTRK